VDVHVKRPRAIRLQSAERSSYRLLRECENVSGNGFAIEILDEGGAISQHRFLIDGTLVRNLLHFDRRGRVQQDRPFNASGASRARASERIESLLKYSANLSLRKNLGRRCARQ